MEIDIRTLLLLLASMAISVFIGIGSVYTALEFLPCEWFGSNFEGACGFAAIVELIPYGIAVAAVSFCLLSWKYLSANDRTSPRSTSEQRSLMLVWSISLILVFASSIRVLFSGAGIFSMIISLVSILSLLISIATSLVILPRFGKRQWFALLPLIPFIGALLLAAIVIHAKSTAKDNSR